VTGRSKPYPLKEKLAPLSSPTFKEICWAAEFWDGDGYCAPGARKATQVTVVQKDTWITEHFRSLFGGSVRSYEMGEHGRRRLYSRWTLHGARARGFLLTIFLLVSPRRQEQIRRAIWRE
jgi:hypothetical protein